MVDSFFCLFFSSRLSPPLLKSVNLECLLLSNTLHLHSLFFLPQLIRVLANLCINEAIGAALAQFGEIVDVLLSLLKRKKDASHELMINVVGTINNLSFYRESSDVLKKRQMDIAGWEVLRSFIN